MRIDRLYLKKYKNLEDFTVDFDASSHRQVVIGRNGVGKSNLLEALAQIFRELDLEENSSFEYEIEYKCNGHLIKIFSKEKGDSSEVEKNTFKREYFIKKTSDHYSKEFSQISQVLFYKKNKPINESKNPDRLIPQYVFGYYSGTSGRFNNVFAKHEENYYKAQAIGKEPPLRPLFLAKPHHSQFALLAFFASYDKVTQEFLAREFRIEKFESVLFALREPYWKKPKTKIKDQRFWDTGGKVIGFLNSLFKHALSPIAGVERKKISVGQTRNFERRYFFIQDETTLRKITEGLDPKEFFTRLESALFSDLISPTGEDVRIKFHIKGSPEPITFKELSEGEQQLLTIIGLMRFTAQNESLFLLDEPDTFLNPAWCMDYLNNIKDYGGEPEQSQIIMTTHSPLTFAGLDKNEVVIIERGRDEKIYSQHPYHAPKGMGFQAILTSDFFGLRSTLDQDTLEKLDRKRYLSLKDDRTPEENEELVDLDNSLGNLDFSKATRDPLYLEFIRAMTKAQEDRPEIKSATPTKADWKLRKKIALDIAKKIKQKENLK